MGNIIHIERTSMKYFKDTEVMCKCGCKMGIDTQLAILLDQIREEFGKPISVSSGARCLAHNKKIGGAPQSWHTKGKAVDLVRTPELEKFIIANLEKWNVRLESLDSTPSWIHIDLGYVSGPRIFKVAKKKAAK